MAGVGVSFRIDNKQAILKVLDKMQDAFSNAGGGSRKLSDILEDRIGIVLTSLVNRNFKESKDSYGVKWLPLKYPRVRNAGKSKPLLDTGRLASSITHRRLGKLRIQIGTNVKYAATHQFGDPDRKPKTARFLVFSIGDGSGQKKGAKKIFAKSVSIPKRPFLPDKPNLPAEWKREIDDAVFSMIKREWVVKK